jgi:hypothetical protein
MLDGRANPGLSEGVVVAERESNEAIAERYAAACAEGDLEQAGRLRHADWAVFWPQSGERVRGNESFVAIAERYPGGSPRVELTRLVGSEDRWIVTPSNTVLKIAGSGDFWWGEWMMTYPDGQTYHVIDLMELRDGLIHRETVYWAPPFEAPEWRRPFVDTFPGD